MARDRRIDDAAIELAEATLDMLRHRNASPVLHVKRAYRAEVTADREEEFLRKLVQYRQRKQRLGGNRREERV